MIVRMSKLRLVGLLSERNAVVRGLMKQGAVEIAPVQMTGEQKEEILKIAHFDDASVRISQIEDELKKISTAISFLSSLGDLPKIQKAQMSFDSFVDPGYYKGTWEMVYAASRLQRKITASKTLENKLGHDLASLLLWEKYPYAFDFEGTKTTAVLAGTLPLATDKAIFEKEFEEFDAASFHWIGSENEQHYISIIVHESAYEKVLEFLRSKGFDRASFVWNGKFEENKKRLESEIAAAKSETQKCMAAAIKEVSNLYKIKHLYDYIYNMQERRKVRHHFIHTDSAFLVGGWVPFEKAQRLKEVMEENYSVFVETWEPETQEEVPVLFKNNSFVYPFEMITEMYALPKAGEIDPSPAMSPFYFMFFGMMVSDAGYGLVMSAITGIFLLKNKTEGLIDKLLKLLFLGGISTFLWGALFGGWFGDFFHHGFNLGIKPIWFNPLDDPMRLLIWSFVFGGIHILFGMGLSGYQMIKRGKVWDAIFDIGSWYFVLIGVGLLFAGNTFGVVGKYMAITGAVLLVLTQGRREKSIIKKIMGGVLSLYSVTGYLSDILSYSRLLALGLATSVIATVVNTMGFLAGGFSSALGTIVIILTFLVGHTFNVAINALGAYVHASRLQYVEFFGKFYEGGGKAFKPLKATTKYVSIK